MIGIVGLGNMGEALVRGLTRKKQLSLSVYDKKKSRLAKIKKLYRIKASRSLDELISSVKTILIAVKPQDIKPVLAAVKKGYKNQLIISIAAGVTTDFIAKNIKKGAAVIRVMPNLAALSGLSISGIAKSKSATSLHLAQAKNIFRSVGDCIVLPEKSLNALTAVSGSGPGYIYYFLYCLELAARKLGFSKTVAKKLVLSTVSGAVSLLSLKDDFSQMAASVASRGGTTEAALAYLEKKKFKKIIEDALKKACLRAKQLSR